MTKRIMNHAALLALALLTATACTRRVQVESEPNRPENRMQQTTGTSSTAVGAAAATR